MSHQVQGHHLYGLCVCVVKDLYNSECRCDERLKSKAERSTRLAQTCVVLFLSLPVTELKKGEDRKVNSVTLKL
jgi:hypothetical protein